MGKRGPKSANSLIYPPKTANKPPKPPVGMNSRARKIWKNLVADLPANHFRPADYPLLRAYCEAESLHFEASEKIGEQGGVIEKKAIRTDRTTGDTEVIVTGVKANPWVAIQTQTAHTMAQLATKLRLATNARVSPDEAGRPLKPQSPRAGLLFDEDEWPPSPELDG